MLLKPLPRLLKPILASKGTQLYTVYIHTAPNGKVYIGITKQKPEYRWSNGNHYKQNKHFYRAIRKYTWKHIKHEIVKDGLTKEQACELEIELIAKYHATDPRYGYNISTGGECGALGVHPSAETRRKMSEARKRAFLNNPELRRKISESEKGRTSPMKGRHTSPETRRKISEANKGKHPSPEARRKLSESIKRAYLNNPELRRKISEAHRGKPSPLKGTHRSTETRRKVSEAVKRAYLNPEVRRKDSESHKGSKNPMYGKPVSEETRRKHSESNKGKNAKAVICVETLALYSSGREAAKSTGVTPSAINNVLRGKSKTCGGYHWKYVEENGESK